MHFGQTLRVLRTTAGMSLRALARKAGLSPAYLSQVETGKLPPPNEEWLVRIEAALSLPEAHLISLTARIDGDVSELLASTPEVCAFLRTAVKVGLTGPDYLTLAAIVRQLGPRGLDTGLERLAPDSMVPAAGGSECTLVQHLNEDRVAFVQDVDSKPALFRWLAERTATHLSELDAETVYRSLEARESKASTGIGSGIAVPHTILEHLQNTFLLLAVVPNGVDYKAIDDEAVTLCFLLLGGPNQTHEHLHLLARIARVCTQANFRAGVLQSRAPSAAYGFIREVASRLD